MFTNTASTAVAASRPLRKSIRLGSLRPGMTLPMPVFECRDDREVLLLSAGTRLTASLLASLEQRGTSHAQVRASDLPKLRAAQSQYRSSRPRVTDHVPSMTRHACGVDLRREPGAPAAWQVTDRSFFHRLQSPASVGFETKSAQKATTTFQSSVSATIESACGVLRCERTGSQQLSDVAQTSLNQIAGDVDLFVGSGLTPKLERYPFRHALQTARLAMAMGAFLGLTKDELRELGVGCLIHDLGMLRISPTIVQAERVLDPREFLVITRHPAMTCDLLANVRDLPSGSRMVAYQMHERMDGSGYPRRRSGSMIHHLARVAAIADTFVALISPRPHRAGLEPHSAMVEVLRQTKLGKFDRNATRALLHTVSLFPIGTLVETSDGRVGKVIRANGAAYKRPTLAILDSLSADDAAEFVDLSRHSDDECQILRPLESLADWQLPAADFAG